jgi:hypothetical protein
VQKWEYRRVRYAPVDCVDDEGNAFPFDYEKGVTHTTLLNQLGAQSWELVGFEGGTHGCYLFKRPLADDA